MKRPWMPLYVADYLKDTTHLGALLSGAYLHLIMDYWQNGKLPSDENHLARIARLTPHEWRRHRNTLASLFQEGWKHKRIDRELAHAVDVSTKRSAAAAARQAAIREQTECKDSANAPTNADTLHTSQSTKKESRGEDAENVVPIRYAFEGRIVRLSHGDFDRWKKSYHAIPDFMAALQAADDYYSENPPKDGKWFFPVSRWLAKEHNQVTAEQEKRRREARSF